MVSNLGKGQKNEHEMSVKTCLEREQERKMTGKYEASHEYTLPILLLSLVTVQIFSATNVIFVSTSFHRQR